MTLVLIENKSDTEEYFAELLSGPLQKSEIILDSDLIEPLFIIKRLFDGDGNRTNDFEPEVVSFRSVISQSHRDITPHIIYHYSSPYTNFNVKVSLVISYHQSLQSLGAVAFGSGIYGLYLPFDKIEDYKNPQYPNQNIYEVICKHPFIIETGIHGYSISAASYATNLYLDNIIQQIDYIPTAEDLDSILTSYEPLIVLWNIVFYRYNIEVYDLKTILKYYLLYYFNDHSLRDTMKGEIVHVQPINMIMKFYGFDSLLSDDPEHNSWGRGCISYEIPSDAFIESSKVRISN